jgi:hypothetical protein
MVLSLPKAILEVSLKKIEETIAGKESNSLRIIQNIWWGIGLQNVLWDNREKNFYLPCRRNAIFLLIQSIFLERCDLRLRLFKHEFDLTCDSKWLRSNMIDEDIKMVLDIYIPSRHSRDATQKVICSEAVFWQQGRRLFSFWRVLRQGRCPLGGGFLISQKVWQLPPDADTKIFLVDFYNDATGVVLFVEDHPLQLLW